MSRTVVASDREERSVEPGLDRQAVELSFDERAADYIATAEIDATRDRQ